MLPERALETGLLILLALMQSVRLWMRRRDRVRADSEEDRRRPREQVTFDLQHLTREVAILAQRMERADAHLSRLAGEVQVMPDKFRVYFVPRELATEWVGQCAHDRKRLSDELERLRGTMEEIRWRRTDHD